MTDRSSTAAVRCPRCGEKVLRFSGTEAVLKNRITIFRGHRTVAKCRHCGMEVEVPVKIVA